MTRRHLRQLAAAIVAREIGHILAADAGGPISAASAIIGLSHGDTAALRERLEFIRAEMAEASGQYADKPFREIRND